MVVLALVKHFAKQYLELYREEERPIIVGCEDNSDLEGYTTVDFKEVVENNIEDFEDAIIVLDDMGDKLNKKETLILQMQDIIIFKQHNNTANYSSAAKKHTDLLSNARKRFVATEALKEMQKLVSFFENMFAVPNIAHKEVKKRIFFAKDLYQL